jgi:hypothetical protein
MDVSRIAAGWIMRVATRHPPSGAEDWARAMRAEADVLETGRIGWAMGCLMTMTWWKLRGDLIYLVSLGVGGAFLFVDVEVLFALPHSVVAAAFFYFLLLDKFLICALLAAYRPDRVYQTALGVTLIYLAAGFFSLGSLSHWDFGDLQILNAPPVVGVSAIVGACLLGASLGAALRRRGAQPAAA